LHIALICVLGVLVYSNTFDVPFHLDDRRNIVDNPLVKDFGYYVKPSKAEEHQLHNSFKNRYVGYLSFALNYKAHGLDVRGYHIVNVTVHVINALLLYLLVVLTLRTSHFAGTPLETHSRAIALFSSLLFVSHPVQTQAVTYIVQRFACLATMFYLLSIVLYAKWRLGTVRSSEEIRPPATGVRKSHLVYILSIACALLAMKTKQIAFTLPLVITLYEFSFFRTALRKRALYLVPLLLTMLVIPFSVMDLDSTLGEMIREVGEVPRTEEISRHDYMLTELRVVVTYLRLLVLPVKQNLDYDYPVYSSFFTPPVLLSFLFLLAHFTLGIYLFYKSGIMNRSAEIQPSPITHYSSRLIAFGILWFFITLSLESSIIPLYPIYEHRLYLPSAGLIIALVSAFFVMSGRSESMRKGAAVFLIVLTVIFACVTHARNSVWESDVGLWEDVVRKSPLKARGHYNLGKAYHEKGLVDESMEQYRTAILLRPNHVDAYNNLGLIYFKRGLTNKAIGLFRIALEMDPAHADLHYNLGIALKSSGRTDEALRHTQRAVVLKPDNYEAHFNLGMLYLEKGLKDRARREFQTTLRINPDYYWARKFLDHTSD
jgi:tetratricopeptide (TPR) repeat protein